MVAFEDDMSLEVVFVRFRHIYCRKMCVDSSIDVVHVTRGLYLDIVVII